MLQILDKMAAIMTSFSHIFQNSNTLEIFFSKFRSLIEYMYLTVENN